MISAIPKDAEGPRYKIIADSILSDIEAGALKPGDKIPPIKKFAERLNVSASTVKRAYEYLENRGYLLPLQGSGTVVAPLDARVAPESSNLKVFLSYSRRDDELTQGGITQLRRRIEEEYELQTGRMASIFQDTKDIGWGMDWRSVIESNLGQAVFFIPILTPGYLRSPNCLGEFKAALTRFEDLGLEEGIYPIEYVDIRRVLDAMHDDQVVNYIKDRLRNRKWRALRNEDPSSQAYRTEVCEIVQFMLSKESDLVRKTDERVRSAYSKSAEELSDDDDLLERVIALQDDCDKVVQQIEAVSEIIQEIGEVFISENTEELSPKGALSLAGRLATKLDPKSDAIVEECEKYSRYLRDVDTDLNALIELQQLFAESLNDDTASQLKSLHKQIADLNETIETPFQQLEDMRNALRKFAKIARVLRSPCRKIDAALDDFASSKEVYADWERKLAEVNRTLSV